MNPDNNFFEENEELINLSDLYNLSIRNKYLILGLTIASVFIGSIYSFTLKKVWKGEFQIVIKDQLSNNKQEEITSNISNLMGGRNLFAKNTIKRQLETEIEILKSPSVLSNIFYYVKEAKEKKGINTSQWRISDWTKNNLDVSLVKNTSIVNLSYKDTERSLILPVLKKISTQYQLYSGKDRVKGINKGIAYLDRQIEIYKNKIIDVGRSIQEFDFAKEGDSSTSIDIESRRLNSINNIRSIEEMLEIVNNLSNESRAIKYLKSISKENKSLIDLDSIDSQIAINEVIYKPNDVAIRDLKSRRKSLIKNLKLEVIAKLKADKLNNIALQKASTRPKELIIKYKEFLKNKELDETTLSSLLNERRRVSLDQARSLDPWELITKPTLFDDPVSPSKRRIVLISFILGLLISFFFVLIKEKNSGLIYSKSAIKKYLGCKYLGEFELSKQNEWCESIKIINSSSIIANGFQKIALIKLGKINNESVKLISKRFEEILKDKEIYVFENLSQSIDCDVRIIITIPGLILYDDIYNLKTNLNIQEKDIDGLIIFTL